MLSKKAIAYLLFASGMLLMLAHTTFPVLWQLSGAAGEYPLSRSIVLYYAQGFTPILGVLLLLFAGLIYEKVEMP
jgi:hypothetical protein